MKKFIPFVAIVVATSSVYAAPQLVRRSSSEAYNVTYDYTDKEKNGWYVSGHADLSFLNFKNAYNAPTWAIASADDDNDKYSFEPVFGGDLAFGHRFGYFFRGELEAGYIGSFSDKDDGFDFELSIPYLMANGYYDFLNGLYVGVGAGLAIPTVKLDGPVFVDAGNRRERASGFIGGLALGYAHKLDDNLVLDFRYRLAGVTGVKHSREITDGVNTADFESKTGFIMDNQLSIGIRYEF